MGGGGGGGGGKCLGSEGMNLDAVLFDIGAVVFETRKRKGMKEGVPSADNYLDKL